MRICDIHTHVLPGVDHGAMDIPTALQMLDRADQVHVSEFQ